MGRRLWGQPALALKSRTPTGGSAAQDQLEEVRRQRSAHRTRRAQARL